METSREDNNYCMVRLLTPKMKKSVNHYHKFDFVWCNILNIVQHSPLIRNVVCRTWSALLILC